MEVWWILYSLVWNFGLIYFFATLFCRSEGSWATSLAFIPVIGPAFYLVLRPSLRSDEKVNWQIRYLSIALFVLWRQCLPNLLVNVRCIYSPARYINILVLCPHDLHLRAFSFAWWLVFYSGYVISIVQINFQIFC